MGELKLSTWTCPDGRAPLIMLEELGVNYDAVPVDPGRGEQHDPGRKTPGAMFPNLIDEGAEGGPLALFEAGPILLYLAERFGHYLPQDPRARHEAMPWVFFQVAQVGPVLRQARCFLRQRPRIQAAVERYVHESRDLLEVLEQRLQDTDYLAGEYGVADMLAYPWVHAPRKLELSYEGLPHLANWVERVGSRPAVRRAMTRQLVARTLPVET